MASAYISAVANGVIAIVDKGGDPSVADDAANVVATFATQCDLTQAIVVFRAMDNLWREIVLSDGVVSSLGTATDARVDEAIARAKARIQAAATP